ncbi:MAG: arginine--tRNA ligase [Bacillota bacterium]
MIDIKVLAAELLNKQNPEIDVPTFLGMLEIPTNPEMGDLALACFRFSKQLRKSPPEIAKEFAEKTTVEGLFSRIEAVGGYLNFFVDHVQYSKSVLDSISNEGEKFGSSNVGEGRTICIDYSAPNIAKPFHVGHLFTTVIGNALYRTYKFFGYNVVGINHLGDWGTQFGKLIVAYKHWGDKEKVTASKVSELVALYVKFHEEAEKDDSLNDEARAWFVKLEEGDTEAKELWQWFVELSLVEFKKVYAMLDIEFDSYNGESFYNDKMTPIIDELKEKRLLIESEGAMIVDLEEFNMPPCLLLKKDGSTLYATRDIAAGFYRKANYGFDKCLYVMGASQSLHFKQWTKVVELMGYEWSNDCVHVPFGMVSIGGKKLATRSGVVVLLEDLFNEAISRTLEIICEKSPDMAQKEETARQIGIGAIVFGYLSSNRIKDISFSWDDALNFDGETGPYVQYAHARTCSLLATAGEGHLNRFDPEKISSVEEFQLIKLLSRFGETIQISLNELEPSIITRYLVDVAQAFNRFYHEHKILVDDLELMDSRLAIVNATRIVLRNGLNLIGLKAPNRV